MGSPSSCVARVDPAARRITIVRPATRGSASASPGLERRVQSTHQRRRMQPGTVWCVSLGTGRPHRSQLGRMPHNGYYVKFNARLAASQAFLATQRQDRLSETPMPDRFLIAATVDRLIYDSESTFSAEDARILLDQVPRKPSPWLQLGIAGKMSGGSTRGFAAGVGDVSIKDNKDRQ